MSKVPLGQLDVTTRLTRGVRLFTRDERGAIAVIFALMLAALLGMISLSFDLGRAWNLETELQHAADSGAIAGATQLDGFDGARERAIKAVISEIARNEQRFSTDTVDADSSGSPDLRDIRFDTNLAIDNGTGKALNRDIKFYSALPISPAVEATSDAAARYIEVNVFPRRVDFSFAAVVGAVTSASPRARAVAGWTSFYCDTPPMMMCNPDEPEGNLDKDVPFDIDLSCRDELGDPGSCVGKGIVMKAHGGGGGNKLGPGDWGYLSLDIYNPETDTVETVSGTKDLSEAIASVTYDNVCTGGELTTRPGNITSIDRYVNMRFDLYWNSDDMQVPNHQPARQSAKGMVAMDDDPNYNPVTNGCRFNPASPSETGAVWNRPGDYLGSPDPGTGRPTVGPDGVMDRYLGPGRHSSVDQVDNNDLTLGSDSLIDPHPKSVTTDPDTGATVVLTHDTLGPGDPRGGQPMMGLVDPPVRAMAFPMDYCAYEASQVDPSVSVEKGVEGCRPIEDGVHIGSGQWDAQTYLDIYHPGLQVADLIVPCEDDLTDPFCADKPNKSDGFRDFVLSRWELYNWEKMQIDNGTSYEYPNMAFEGKPRCYKAPQDMGTDYTLSEPPADADTLDRRIIVMAVVNCSAWDVKGKATIERTRPDGMVAVFLTEPMGYTQADTMYGEIVDPRGLDIDETELNPDLVQERILLIE